MYINDNYNDCHRQNTTRRIYIYKAKNPKRLYTQKTRHFAQIKTIPCYVVIYKQQDNLRQTIIHENVEVGICIQKNVSLCYVTYLYTKVQTLRKKQDNLS